MPNELSVTKYQRGPSLKIVFEFRGNSDDKEEKIEEIHIADLVRIRIKFKNDISKIKHGYSNNPDQVKHDFSMKSVKSICAGDSTVKMNIGCKNLNYSKQIICPEEWSEWQEMGSVKVIQKNSMYCSVISVTIDVHKVGKPGFAKLYEDTELTDFHLRTDGTEKGSVAVHKICLAAYSDVFKTMFSGQWKETQEDCIKIKNVTLETLQNLKKYIYLGILPPFSSQCRPLLLLAARYFIDDLKAECVRRLALSVMPEDLHSLHGLACENNIPELSIAISQLTPDDVVQSAYEIEEKRRMFPKFSFSFKSK